MTRADLAVSLDASAEALDVTGVDGRYRRGKGTDLAPTRPSHETTAVRQPRSIRHLAS